MESEHRRFRAAQIVALIATGILPLLIVLLGVLMILCRSVVTVSFAITYMILPCAVFAGCFFLIRSNKKAWAKAVLCVLLIIAMLFAFVFMMTIGHYSILDAETGSAAITAYQKDTEAISVMPEVSDLGQPKETEYYYFYNQAVVFINSECYILFCQYTDTDYLQEKQQLEERYIFQKEAPSALGYSTDPIFTIDGYTFRFLSFEYEKNNLMYPKSMVMIGENDETNEIVYLFYYDDDIDYIESMEEHFLNDFGWKYIR